MSFIAALLSGFMAIGPVATAVAQAQESSNPEEMAKELRQLRARLQQVRSALGEAAEFDRMSAEAISRARRILDGGEAPPPAEGAAPGLPDRSPRAEAAAPPRTPAAAAAAAAVRRRAAAAPEAAGTVRGKVVVPPGEPVAYVFVENIRGPATPGKVTIEQVRKQFVPSWAVIQRGKTIEFPNLDNIYHNVFSLSSGNSFDLGLYAAGSESKSHTFNEPGVVDIHCNIHPNMASSVLVVPNKFFTRVNANGTFELPGVPAGKRKIAAWAPGSKLSSDWVTIESGSSAEISLRLEPKSPGHTRKDGRPYGSYE
ncbi:MAG TPA: carboxypeptidase regulatory-like domain-containing protein [Polyangia bacterium]